PPVPARHLLGQMLRCCPRTSILRAPGLARSTLLQLTADVRSTCARIRRYLSLHRLRARCWAKVLLPKSLAVDRTRPADSEAKFRDRPYQFASPIDRLLHRRRWLLCKAYHPAE